MSLIGQLRIDVGDDSVTISSSSSPVSQIAGSGSSLMRHLRIDVGDDVQSPSSELRFVYAPSGSIDNAVARFDGTTGRYIQDSSVTITDTGDVTIAGDLTVIGNVIGLIHFRVITSGATASILTTDNFVVINKILPGPTTVNLPTGNTGQFVVVKDGRGDANINNITIVPPTDIDGLSNLVMTQAYQSYTLLYDGNKWSVV